MYGKLIDQIKKIVTAKRVKTGLLFFIVCIVAAGSSAWYIHQEKIERKTQIRMAKTRMVEYQAQQRNLQLITMEQARALTAKAIGKDESSLTFEEMFLENKWDDKYHDSWKNKRSDYYADLHSPRSNPDASAVKNNDTTSENLRAIPSEQERYRKETQDHFFPVYEITCYSGFFEYEIEIDALTGAILDSDVESRFWD